MNMCRLLVSCAAFVSASLAFGEVQTVASLNAKYAKFNGVSFRADEKGDPVAVLKNTHGSCEVLLRGALVASCAFRGDAHPLLFVPSMGYVALPGERDFIHGGVPLLWPWFGSSGAPLETGWNRFKRNWLFGLGAKPAEAPFHATARYSLFEVKDVSTADGETALTLLLRTCAEVSEWTPGEFELEYRITLGAHKLGLKLTTKNVGKDVFSYREGYHPYFCVSDCYAVTLSGVDGCPYESDRPLPCDVTHIWQGKVPEWPGCDLFRFKEEKSVLTLEDPAWKRDIVLTTTGARDVVTWCQDVKGASNGTMNIRPEECRRYFCIEPSNFYPESEIKLDPGASHAFETVITVRAR